jgi:hypothetical protein
LTFSRLYAVFGPTKIAFLIGIRNILFNFFALIRIFFAIVRPYGLPVRSQQAVVGRAVTVEEGDVGLHIAGGEGPVVAVSLVDAVQAGTHAQAVGLGGAAGECEQQGDDGQ